VLRALSDDRVAGAPARRALPDARL
jgi:hypothetical protein